ncbi:hypothetical protein JIG36_06025 [Actinoplanes sp. LDG1-06]|uniref:Uncharacterized protein n=1 Tax=Paractinoplanes ovalisporus TaxID=2810368 RepID=A0ABS2A5J5_9ACTN|nr:hypothetical protein [Actinoplanes ovalisporus]MBM2615117.1 hypothetical protein [Actinoplanes ovalisporus]
MTWLRSVVGLFRKRELTKEERLRQAQRASMQASRQSRRMRVGKMAGKGGGGQDYNATDAAIGSDAGTPSGM